MQRKFTITREDYELGVTNTVLAILEDLTISSDTQPGLADFREEALAKALAYTDEDLDRSQALEGFRRIYRALGYGPELVPAAEDFVHLIRERRVLPKINAAVDAYNTVVLDTLMGIGAHDLNRIQGNVRFQRSLGTERFTRLGKSRSKLVPIGDFIYCDDEKVLARLASDDCDEAKIQPHTKEILLVIEAHEMVTQEFVTATMRRACERIVQFCGGTFRIFQPEMIADAAESLD